MEVSGSVKWKMVFCWTNTARPCRTCRWFRDVWTANCAVVDLPLENKAAMMRYWKNNKHVSLEGSGIDSGGDMGEWVIWRWRWRYHVLYEIWHEIEHGIETGGAWFEMLESYIPWEAGHRSRSRAEHRVPRSFLSAHEKKPVKSVSQSVSWSWNPDRNDRNDRKDILTTSIAMIQKMRNAIMIDRDLWLRLMTAICEARLDAVTQYRSVAVTIITRIYSKQPWESNLK